MAIAEMQDDNGRAFGNAINDHWHECWKVHPDCAKSFVRRLARIVHQHEPYAKVLRELGDYDEPKPKVLN